MYAMLGDICFEVLNSFSQFEETHNAVFAKHEVLAGRPRLQATGNDLTSINFGLQLHWKLGNPDRAYTALLAAKNAQQALALTFGSGRFMGWFVIQQLSSSMIKQDGQGRTLARELSVELLEFVGDPNNPLPTPGILSGQNPLLALLPQSVQGTVSQIASAVQTGVHIYQSVNNQVNRVQSLITQARSLIHDPASLIGVVADAINMGAEAANNLSQLPELNNLLSHLTGAADFFTYTAQAMHQMQNTVAILQNGYDSGNWSDQLDNSTFLISSVADSMDNAAAGAQSLTAWLAARKDDAA